MNSLRRIRILRGLTRKQLAEIVEASPMALCYLENGKRSLSEKWLGKFSKALNCTKAELLGESEFDQAGINNGQNIQIHHSLNSKYLAEAEIIAQKILDDKLLKKADRFEILPRIYDIIEAFYESNDKKKFKDQIEERIVIDTVFVEFVGRKKAKAKK